MHGPLPESRYAADPSLAAFARLLRALGYDVAIVDGAKLAAALGRAIATP